MKLLALLFILSGCSTFGLDPDDIKQELKEGITYKRDMILTVNGASGEGVLVSPNASKYSVHVYARGNLDLFIMTTCNRDWTKESAWNVTSLKKRKLWGKKKITHKREIKFTYAPNLIEKEDACPMWLHGSEKDKGRHSWGYIDFVSPKTTLKATLLCNGETIKAGGVSACQSRAGLIQRIVFPHEVLAAGDPSTCKISKKKSKAFDISLTKGFCTYIFRTVKKPREEHRLVTIGYEKILVRQ